MYSPIHLHPGTGTYRTTATSHFKSSQEASLLVMQLHLCLLLFPLWSHTNYYQIQEDVKRRGKMFLDDTETRKKERITFLSETLCPA